MNYKLLSILLLCISYLGAEPEEIRIYLTTASKLEPLYLSNVYSSEGSHDQKYLDELGSVFYFDLTHNGSTKIVSRLLDKDEMLKSQDKAKAFNLKAWKTSSVAYVIRPTISGQTMSVDVLSVHDGSLKHFSDIKLTGQIGKDRRLVHKVADAIHKALFGVEGIAATKILYSAKQRASSSNQWISDIWSCDWDGANPHQQTKESSYCVSPVFLPQNAKYASDRFLYVSYKMGQPKIFIASLGEGVGRRLIDLKGNQLLPAISPQRDKVAFICDAAGRTDLFLQEFHPDQAVSAKPVQLFSYPQSTQASPAFSPDGSRIAFVSDKDGAPRIYVIPATFSSKRPAPHLITKTNHENSCPAWSPDGKKLAYSAKTKGVRQIWIYDFEAKEERQLTDGPGNKENPAWAPNSLHLVFNSTDASASDLYLVNLNQPEVIKISQGPAIKHYPTWGCR